MVHFNHAGRHFYGEQLPMIGDDGVTPLFGSPETQQEATASYLAPDGLGDQPYEDQTGGHATYNPESDSVSPESAAALLRNGRAMASRCVRRAASIYEDQERARVAGNSNTHSSDNVAASAYQAATQQNMERYAAKIRANATPAETTVSAHGVVPRLNLRRKPNNPDAMIIARQVRDARNRAAMPRQHFPADTTK